MGVSNKTILDKVPVAECHVTFVLVPPSLTRVGTVFVVEIARDRAEGHDEKPEIKIAYLLGSLHYSDVVETMGGSRCFVTRDRYCASSRCQSQSVVGAWYRWLLMAVDDSGKLWC